MARKKKETPVTYRGNPMPTEQLQNFMTEWSLSQAEANHVETIEEANDFNIPDDDSEDFLQNVTVYEMHEAAEENLRIYQELEKEALAESNETGQGAQDQHLHDQSAPLEPNPLDPQTNQDQIPSANNAASPHKP